jgi:hypothetical protein
MASPGQVKRIARVRRRAIAAVREAYENGDISARMADTLLYLSPAKQAAELERRLSETAERERRHQLVATAIRSYLDGLNGRKVDLHQLSGVIRQALGYEYHRY